MRPRSSTFKTQTFQKTSQDRLETENDFQHLRSSQSHNTKVVPQLSYKTE